MKFVKDIGDVQGKTVFVRADFNVPVSDGVITDDFRIQKTLGVVRFLREIGARIILASHFEGEGGSLAPVAKALEQYFPVTFVQNYYPQKPEEIDAALGRGNVVLLENLRVYKEEKENNEDFAKHLASFADIYVNEAFASSHRAHASIVGIPKFLPAYAGFVFGEEVEELSKALHPERPFVFVLGGAKFETKVPLIEKFYTLADKVFIGGALANDFIKAAGFGTGTSLLSSSEVDVKKFISDKLIMPIDVLVSNSNEVVIKKVEDVAMNDCIVDVGPKTLELVAPVIASARCVLWNGPLGNYELGHKDATLALAKLIAESQALSIVGGGDTVASIAELNLSDKFSFISTGGGAMLDFLANETLPGIQALNNSEISVK